MWVLVTGDLFSAKVRNSTLKCKIVYNIIRIVSQCLRTARSRVLSSYPAASLFWWVWPLIKLSTYILTTTRLVILIVQFICITQRQSQNPRKMKKFPFLMILIMADYDYDITIQTWCSFWPPLPWLWLLGWDDLSIIVLSNVFLGTSEFFFWNFSFKQQYHFHLLWLF